MLKRVLCATWLAFTASLLIAGAPGCAEAQLAAPPHTDVMGTYAADTQRLPSSGSDGCWLEAAPVGADSIHVQILCRYPGPGHHLGVLDAQLPSHGDTLVF